MNPAAQVPSSACFLARLELVEWLIASLAVDNNQRNQIYKTKFKSKTCRALRTILYQVFTPLQKRTMRQKSTWNKNRNLTSMQ